MFGTFNIKNLVILKKYQIFVNIIFLEISKENAFYIFNSIGYLKKISNISLKAEEIAFKNDNIEIAFIKCSKH